ncbi:hypothetical protein [Rhodococcus qingshengii]|uniref:hypothetical protein n=1 Tax=Rhodococcus qingshengii TaxID=334542 RepID=UPI002AFEF461|nr:hypothetical protein [Rhodococcus qingshengii]MEA1796695.1 hypothetical protein [Rhodococcus qingshengii]
MSTKDLGDLGVAAGDIIDKAFTLGYETGRKYVPPGGMALTAEQVEDVRTMLDELASERDACDTWDLYDRLRALFPATEPAEEAAREGDCALPPAHDGPCNLAPAEPAEEETKAERRSFATIQDVPNDTLFHTHGGEGSSLLVRNFDGQLRLYIGAPGMMWSSAMGEDAFIRSTGPFVEVPWSAFEPTSSPVAPAPTETGPWKTWQEVPEGVWVRSEDDNGWKWIKRDGVRFTSNCDCVGAYKSRLSDEQIASFAPFVAASKETGPWA